MAGRPKRRAKAANGGIAFTSRIADDICALISEGQSQTGLNSLNSFVSLPETVADDPRLAGDLDERAALIEFGAGVSRSWAEGYAALTAMPPPTGFLPERWHRIIDAAGAFMDRWAAGAIECGWSDLDVFGCHPGRPDQRFDCMGLALLLDRCEIVRIDESGADLMTATGARQHYRRRPLPADTISLWALARGGEFPNRNGVQ
jgi:hypothetical protein